MKLGTLIGLGILGGVAYSYWDFTQKGYWWWQQPPATVRAVRPRRIITNTNFIRSANKPQAPLQNWRQQSQVGSYQLT